MFKKQKTVKSVLFAILLAGLNSCSKTTDVEPAQPYDKGVLVINQGNFFSNNGSISLLDKESKSISYDIFQKENSRTLAGGVVDYTETNNIGIILVDNSSVGKDNIEIVNARTFKSIATIKTDIENPRHVVAVSSTKAYVSCWDSFNSDYSYKAGYIAVIDLVQNKVTKKIVVQAGAEDMILIGSEVFVGNVDTGNSSSMNVIDSNTDSVKSSFVLGADAKTFVLDANNKLWTATGSEIVRINPSTKTIEARLKISSSQFATPERLTINKDKSTIYFTNNYFDANYNLKGEVYSFKISNTSISTGKSFINKVFTGLAYDAEKDLVYGGLTPSYTQAGYVYRYQTNGNLVDSVKAEISPIKFYVK